MAGELLIFVGLLALSGSCMAGIATYAYNPFINAYAAVPASSYVKSAPLIAAAPVVKAEEIDPHPQYEFAYNVQDLFTGDIKHQVESRDGGNVAGSYSVVDADGYKRTVTYTADDVNGFNAVVQRDPIVAKAVVSAAPIVKTYSAGRLVQTAPVVKTYAAAPVVPAYAAAPLVQATPVVRTYAAAPVVHSAPIIKPLVSAPLVATAPVVNTYSTASFAPASYLASAPVQQVHRLPLQHQLSYFSSPALAVQQPNHQVQEQHGLTELQTQEKGEAQQVSAPEKPENEPSPIEYPEQEQQQQQHQQAEEEQQKQAEEQLQQNQQQKLVQEQQQLFTQQQEQFAAQQQQVILQQQQLVEQQQKYFQQQQHHFNNNQQFPPYPQYEIPQNQLNHPEQGHNTDSDVIEGRSATGEKSQEETASEHKHNNSINRNTSFGTTLAPAPVNEEHKESDNQDKTKST